MTRSINDTHDPSLRSWVDSANDPATEFPIQNLPFGVFRRHGHDAARIGVAIGNQIVDLRAAAARGLLSLVGPAVRDALALPVLNGLMALGPPAPAALRSEISRWLRADGGTPEPRVLVAMQDAELLVPVAVGNYSDFYASIHHATNVGRLFRPDNPVMPNYKYIPIAYHGRASSVIVSGTPIRRPQGQVKPATAAAPSFGPTRALDYELEVGLLVGRGNPLGQPVPIDEADEHLFGACLLNDWSARDIQSWEYQPLGPFLAKSFASTLSPWVVTMEALAPFRCPPASRAAEDPRPMPYLAAVDESAAALDLRVEAAILTPRMRDAGMAPLRLTASSTRHLYWTLGQMVAHHTSNGCNLVPGDLLGTGTVSGPEGDGKACLLEITAQGTQPVALPTGEQRTYLEDGDEVLLRGWCERDGFCRIGFGECRGVIAGGTQDAKTA